MATWDNVVYTTQGLNLMAKLQTGAALEITRAIGSDGHVSADALPALTEITAKQTLTLSDAIYKGNGQALLPVTLYNRGLTEGYPLRQIGIYATDPDDGEVLMLVAQSETPDTIPTEIASPDFVANFSFYIALGNAGRINVTYSLTDMATKADYTAFVEQIEGKLGQPNGIATLDALGNPQRARPAYCSKTLYVDNPIPIPHYDDFRNYKTPGTRLLVSTITTCKSVDNMPPEAIPGILEVTEFNHDKTNTVLEIMQTYTATSGNIWTLTYNYITDRWSDWKCGAIKPMQPYVSSQLTGNGYVYFGCYGLDTGSYLFSACGNFNKAGSDNYRAVYTLIIHVSCDYDTQHQTVIARVSYAPLLVTCNFGLTTDDKLDVGFNNMLKTTPWAAWQSGDEPGKIYISATSSTTSSPSDWSCKLLKLI